MEGFEGCLAGAALAAAGGDGLGAAAACFAANSALVFSIICCKIVTEVGFFLYINQI